MATERLIDTAWILANSALWNTTVFDKTEIIRAKELIGDFIKQNDFTEFCERILLARHYLTSQLGRYIPLPSVWMDKDNKLGFAGTRAWFDRIEAIREAVPGYKAGIKSFAKALLELTNQPSAAHYNYWKNYFIDRSMPQLLSLFQAVVINHLYSIDSNQAIDKTKTITI